MPSMVTLLKKMSSERRARSFAGNQSGATAVEFGLVALPFLMMTFFIINIGMYYYTVNSIDKGLKDATRQILTGTAQTTAMTVGGFRSLVCTQANMGGSSIDCSQLNILMTATTTNWATLIAQAGGQSCVTGGNLTNSTGASTDLLSAYTSGTAAYVLVTACYKWQGSAYLPFLNLGTFGDGSTLIQSVMAFQTEPYS